MATATSTKLDKRTLEILAGIEWDGEAAKLTCGQLTRAEYVKVNSVLETLGGKWSRKAKAHLFDADARDRVEAVIEAREIVTAADEKKAFQFYETPDKLADFAVEKLAVSGDVPGDMPRLLEPSAGTGQLLRALRRANVLATTQAFEINGQHEGKLHEVATHAYIGDFLLENPDEWEPFDYVLMNPPFAPAQADIDHVLHAWKFLKPGGRLVAIMSPGWTFRTNKKSKAFREFVTSNEMSWTYNDEGAFKESGTMVNTVTLVMDKPQA